MLPSGEITHFIDGEAVLRYAAPELDPADKDAQPLIAAAGGKLQLRQGYIALAERGPSDRVPEHRAASGSIDARICLYGRRVCDRCHSCFT